MKCESIEIKSKKFREDLASAGEYDPSTGLGKKTIGLATLLFVKDDETGKIVCYSQSRKNANARFVARVEEDKANDIFYAYYSLKGSDCTTIKLSSLSEKEVAKIKEDINNSETKKLYTKLNPNKYNFSGIHSATIPTDVSIAQIEIPNNDMDTTLAYMVVSKHPTKAGQKSWYILKDGFVFDNAKGMLDKDGNVVDLTDPQAIFNAGGHAIWSKVQYDKDGAIIFGYYTEGGKGHTPCNNVARQTDKSMPELAYESNTLKKVSEMKKTFAAQLKSSKIFKCAAIVGTTIVLAGALALGHFWGGQALRDKWISDNSYQTANYLRLNQDEAFNYGYSQMQQFIDELDQKTLLTYKTEGKFLKGYTGGIYDVTKTPVKTYEPEAKYDQYYVVEQDGKKVKLSDYDYTSETVRGAYACLGENVVKEAAENGLTVGVRADENSNVSSVYYYAVDPTAPVSAINDKESMINYLNSVYNNENVAAKATAQYESSYDNAVKGLISKDNETIKNDEEINRIDFESAEVKTSVISLLRKFDKTKTARSFEDDELNIAYASAKDKVVYVNTAKNGEVKYLYKIDLSNAGEIKTLADFQTALEKATGSDLTESINLDILLKNYDLTTKIEEYKQSYAAENGLVSPLMFVANHKTLLAKGTNEVEIAPTLIAISSNGAKIAETEMTRVSVAENKPYSISAMNAVSIFGSDLDGIVDNLEIYARKQVSSETKTYDRNEISVSSAESLKLTNKNDDEKIL